METSNDPSGSFTISKRSVRQIGIGLAVLGILVVIVIAIVGAVRAAQPGDTLLSSVNSSEFQAVFLTNNQIYVGKLTGEGGGFVDLRRVYQLVTSGGKRRLVPVKGQAEDLLMINRSQILFVENLRPSSDLTQTILRGSSP